VTDLADCTAHELLRLYRHRSASPLEATRAVLARIAACEPVINAYCLVDEEYALREARASEARWQRGEPAGMLDGVPCSIKDLILTRGWPTRRGSRTIAAEQAWDVDAPVTARLREHHAVLLGKTCTPEFGCKCVTDSPLTGITRNPWDPSRTPGGSSGGTAAAVAAGMGPLSVGTDGAGSVRVPASFCGNVGLKPSFGRVPAYPLSPFGTVAHLGPHAMSVTDVALALSVFSEPDPRDWHSLPYEPRDYTVGLNDGVRGWKVAYSPRLGFASNIDPEVAAAVEAAALTFQDLGAHVEQIDPGFDDPIEIAAALWFAGSMTVFRGLTEAQRLQVDPMFAWQAEQGGRLSALDLQRFNLRRGELGTLMRQFHQHYEILLTPTVAVTALEAKATGQWPLSLEAFLGFTPFSYPFNLTQQPAITVPCGLSRQGLPIGLQIVGPMHADDTVLRAARAYESARPVGRPPRLA
jgi:aspartyl-tRNA(Asn)/glutamyl-tRNA(Gln) amidotransferase subunit A